MDNRETNTAKSAPPPPFAATYSPNLPELIHQLGCTIALSTYQAGKIVFVSAKNDDEIVQLPRSFRNAMAIGVEGNRIAVASANEVHVLAHEPGLAGRYPAQPGVYDTIYVPRASYFTGAIDLHGLAWGNDGLWTVNTVFSCLCLIDDRYSFIPKWKPSFISAFAPEDRCHLNGMAMHNGEPLWVTALGTGNEPHSWRPGINSGGVVIHVPSGEIAASGLPMPHTPRLIDGKLYVLFSSTGEIALFDQESGRYDIVNRIKGFIRGMARCGDYLFIGQSRVRQKSSAFAGLQIARDATHSGFTVLHMPTGSTVAEFRYLASVDEIFDLAVLPGLRRPGILSPEKEVHSSAIVIPGTSFWAVRQDTK
ncbi:MAG TPA: TIGR03032 family protein [Spirochaetota bacterium]|nr:TIGR03032 family protein [Spirochaetota bacterium]